MAGSSGIASGHSGVCAADHGTDAWTEAYLVAETFRNLINFVRPLFLRPCLSLMTEWWRDVRLLVVCLLCGFEWKPICAQRVVDATSPDPSTHHGHGRTKHLHNETNEPNTKLQKMLRLRPPRQPQSHNPVAAANPEAN